MSWNFWPTDSFQGLSGVGTVRRRRCLAWLFRDGLSVFPLAATVLKSRPKLHSTDLALLSTSHSHPSSPSPIPNPPPSIVYSFFLSCHSTTTCSDIRFDQSPLFFSLGPPAPGVNQAPSKPPASRATPWCLVLPVPRLVCSPRRPLLSIHCPPVSRAGRLWTFPCHGPPFAPAPHRTVLTSSLPS